MSTLKNGNVLLDSGGSYRGVHICQKPYTYMFMSEFYYIQVIPQKINLI